LSLREIIRELKLTQEIVNKYLGHDPGLFRLPHGEVNLKMMMAALACNLTTASSQWTLKITRRYSSETHDPADDW